MGRKGIRVTGKAPSSIGGRHMTGSTPTCEESAKQPEECQMIGGGAPSPQNDSSSQKGTR